MKRMAIFASGTGSNAENIIHYFQGNSNAMVALVVSNNAKSGAIEKAKSAGVETLVLSKEEVMDGKYLMEILRQKRIDLIVLAGYLKMIPAELTRAFDEAMVNIHPALLPKFGGAGMYGRYVHEAVVSSGEQKTGITVHFVNEEYDKGKIIAQKEVAVDPNDTPVDVENKVRKLELEWYPRIIESVILKKPLP